MFVYGARAQRGIGCTFGPPCQIVRSPNLPRSTLFFCSRSVRKIVSDVRPPTRNVSGDVIRSDSGKRGENGKCHDRQLRGRNLFLQPAWHAGLASRGPQITNHSLKLLKADTGPKNSQADQAMPIQVRKWWLKVVSSEFVFVWPQAGSGSKCPGVFFFCVASRARTHKVCGRVSAIRFGG